MPPVRTMQKFLSISTLVRLAPLLLYVAGMPAHADRGANIFFGKEALRARIFGHQEALPPDAARCANCHQGSTASQGDAEWAPLLDRNWLQQVRMRRGGPAYAYDMPSFCHTLRTGIDPSHVVLGRAMPRFAINDRQCRELWNYLTESRKNEGK